jgi:hypothetical protein
MSSGQDGIGTAADLAAAASTLTRLSDFGAGDWRDGLEVLLESYARDADLTPRGVRVARALLRGAVTGLPRTGTTALHRLLTADPAHQGLQLWLAEVPQPRPPAATWPGNPVFQLIQAGVQRHQVTHPEFMGVHYLAADQVEECWQLLRQSMRSVSWECLAHLPGYSSWLQAQDWTQAYRRHRRNLQLIGLPDPGRRWVLKNPSHLFALGALLEVYPDALIIQTHRSPRTAIASVCSLAAQASDGWSGTFRGEVLGRDQLETWARGLDCFTAARAGADPARFCDVDYGAFVADPLATMEQVYGWFGLALTGAAVDAMRALHTGSTGGRPAHRYALSDFGLTGEQVDERFAGYLSARA